MDVLFKVEHGSAKGTVSSQKKPRVCFVGPMLGTQTGWVPNPMEILSPYLAELGYTCLLTSRIVNRYRRLADIVSTLIADRNEYDLICLQVYSGRSIVLEDIVSATAQFLRKPLTMMLHGGAIPDKIRHFPKWNSRILKRAKTIITPSTFLAEAIKPYGFQAKVIPNLISLENYSFKPRRKLAPRLLWMRTFYDYYNPSMAVFVLKQLLIEFPDAELTMAGQEKGIEGDVRQLVESLGLGTKVHFPGFLTDDKKQAIFNQHDIFLNTTYIDNMPVCLVEAGAFGLPIVSTNVGGVPYLVENEKNALLVKPNDVNGMAQAICRLLHDDGFAEKLSRNGRQMAERSSPANVLPLWEEVFYQALN